MKTDRYLGNVARDFIGQLHLTPEDMGLYGAQSLYNRWEDEVKTLLGRMRPGTLGRIAACGRGGYSEAYGTSLYAVHCGAYLEKRDDGGTLLLKIACTAVIAEMADILTAKA